MNQIEDTREHPAGGRPGLILASASPRRRELMGLLGIPFQVMAAQGEERVTSQVPHQVVEQLSCQKAEEIALQHPGCWVIGSDTVVAYNGEIFGKPKDDADAFRMLRLLQGHVHQVYTGVTLLYIGQDKSRQCRTFYEKTDVEVWEMTDEEIWAYIQTKEPADKAGAYGIQGCFCVYVKGICGDYQNVVGLPVSRLYHEMKEWKLL